MRAAVGQLCSTANRERNAAMCASIIRRAAAAGCQLVLLPEASDFIAGPDQVRELAEPVESNKFLRRVRDQAKESGVWVGVCIHEATDGEKCFNSSLLINPAGEIVQNYHKLHLLDVNYGNEGPILESKTTLRGEALLEPHDTPVGKLGMLTCYDLRFPEGALSLRRKGAEIIAYPSAFTMQTGPPHWEVLLRARAIETQSYVLAAAQIGKHSETRETYGHAMIVDPWGSVVAQASTRPPSFPPDESDVDCGDFVSAELDLGWVQQLRKEMPLWEQRRTDVYPEV
ncbi:hypothetical protein JCM8202_005396 [Rhodotorula sphaerocarpa]